MFNEGSPPLGSLPKCLKKCSPPCSPPFTKEFVNRYRIRINKGHLLFTEHQKFWKSIKNPSQKVKKCEIFSRFWKNLLIYIVNVLIYIVNTKKCVDLHSKYEGKSIQIYANHHHHRNFRKHFTFFHFLRWIFYGFSKFLMFWKEEMPLVNSNAIYIYEIFL